MNYIIVSWVSSFDFPLAEALRKQIWWKALEQKEKGGKVSIYILGANKTKSFTKENIKINLFEDNILKGKIEEKVDILHFITGIIGIRHLEAFKIQANEKLLTLTDGCIFGDNKKFFRKILSVSLPLIFDRINVFSNYQYNQFLIKSKVKKIEPLLPKIKKKYKLKSKKPTLFYMGHFSYFKGVDLILDAYDILKKEFIDLKLVFFFYGLKGDKELLKRVKQLLNKYPNDVILKGKINPCEELSKSWVYLYPFKTPCKTMAFALSLYESLKCGTPFVACDIGANKEFFDEKYLIPPNNLEELVNKTRIFLNEQ